MHCNDQLQSSLYEYYNDLLSNTHLQCNLFQFVFPQRHDTHFVFQVTLSNLMAGCRIVQRGPQAKLLLVAQYFLQVQKVILMAAYHSMLMLSSH